MRKFGLIGKNIIHSFSEKYFTEKFSSEKIKDAVYKTYDLKDLSQIENLLNDPNLIGFNVTIPFKEQIIPYLDELSTEAKAIGAVNCVKLINGKKIGYNTDAYGFEKSIFPLLENHHKNALILGDGGAAKAVKFALNQLEIPFQTVNRKGEMTYQDLNADVIKNHPIIINCTPLGTFPNIAQKPNLPYQFIGSKHLIYDLIYNPEKTEFLKLSEANGAKIKNGYEMLVLQAEKSWEIWNELIN